MSVVVAVVYIRWQSCFCLLRRLESSVVHWQWPMELQRPSKYVHVCIGCMSHQQG